MARNRIQKLLLQPEYIEFKDNVLAEAPFIELDKCGEPIRQVLLGLTENCFIIATENLPDYVIFPSVKYDADIDLDTDGLELEWIVPVGFIEIVAHSSDRILNVDSRTGKMGHFLISDIWGSAKKDWIMWKEALTEVQNDPYGYMKCLFKNFEIPDKMYDSSLITRRKSQLYQKKAKSLESLTNKVMNKMYEIQDELESRKTDKDRKGETKSNNGKLNCCTRETGSQTYISYDNGDRKEKKKRKRKSFKRLLRRLCFGGKPKQRPT